MRRRSAAVGSAIFFLAAPGVVAGLIPWWLTSWHVAWRTEQSSHGWLVPVVQIVGVLLVLAGVVALVHAFVRFVVEGLGTPAPVAPTRRLVVGGLYRYVRNPMYVAVLAVLLGQALLLGRPVLLGYAVCVWLATAGFVRWYEEPTLRREFGAGYEAYRRAVPAWLPRLTPWSAPSGQPAPGHRAR